MSEAVASDVVSSKVAAGSEGGDLTEEAWRSHVARAAKYQRSNTEYCKRHGLELREFRAHKRRFRAQQAKLPSGISAFVQVEAKEPAQREARRPIGNSTLPDPRWTAEFVAALLAAHR